MKTPVLLVSNFLSASGGSRGVCEELAARLSASGAFVLTTSDQTAKIPRLLDMLRTAFVERKNYAAAQVDVYSGPAFIWAEMVCALLSWLGKPFILSLHGGNLPDFARRNPGRVRRLLHSANAVTTPSRYLQEKLSSFRPDIRMLPNALDIAHYPTRLRKTVQPSLVWLRTFHDIYNPALAAEVVGRLIRKFPRVNLTMVGPDKSDGSLQRTKEAATKLDVHDHICFPGGVPKLEVPAWLNAADIFLNTTNVDNMPVSVLEAMACGLCIISTNVGGLPYLLSDGEDALLVPPNDAAAMTAAVERLLTEPRLALRLSGNARKKAENHDWNILLPQWKELFQSIGNPLPHAGAKTDLLKGAACSQTQEN